jgi:DEAD/DEAH box helicase domain-containing protein
MSLAALIQRWRYDPEIAANIVEWHTLPARQAQFRDFPEALHPALKTALRRGGISQLYLHQLAAWEHIQALQHVVIVTGTASGKTLAYNLPVLHHLLQEKEARALYLFPTKALAQDQKAALQALLFETDRPDLGASLTYGVYDGDTPAGSRPAVRDRARIVISNPDMLHTGILPHHATWAEFFRNLRFVVIDELHAYRGVFGSHVANVLRRLRRVARFYGAAPQFILTSATIANPSALAERLVEAPVVLVDQDGSERGERHFLIYNPPITNRELGLRRSLLQETVQLAEDLYTYQVQTIIFGRTRRTVELILTGLRDRLPAAARNHPAGDSGNVEAQAVRGYRSGYLPHQRREIEKGLRSGDVRMVVATTALELGIDIGGMGAALIAGYPGTIAATWQQAGRAGRGQEASLATLVTSAQPLDQFLARHPEYFFGRSPEQALINPDNLLILLGHLRCAAFELPFEQGEPFGNLDAATLEEFLDFLRNEGVIHQAGSRYFWMSDQYPAQNVSLRSASADNVVLQMPAAEGWLTVGEVDRPSALWMVHPGAVYLHEGQTFLVEELDLEQNVARMQAVGVDYYTEPRNETTVQLLEQYQQAQVSGGSKAYGEISVTSQVTGFRKVRWADGLAVEHLGWEDLQLPPSELITTGYWLSISEQTVEALRAEGLWNSDPNHYGPNWSQQRDLARGRDGYRCQVCGAPEGERSHDVHHKIPFRAFLSYLQANQLENLVTLCHACHRRVETAVRIRSGLGGLGFVLSHLAPLFLMCDPGDLGVHSDPQSPLAEGRPAVVLYDQVPAGIGFSENLFNLHEDLLLRALELVEECDCADGCPSCVGPGGERGIGARRETTALLKALC